MMQNSEYSKTAFATKWLMDVEWNLWVYQSMGDGTNGLQELGRVVEVRHATDYKVAKQKYNILKLVVTDGDPVSPGLTGYMVQREDMLTTEKACNPELKGYHVQDL